MYLIAVVILASIAVVSIILNLSFICMRYMNHANKAKRKPVSFLLNLSK